MGSKSATERQILIRQEQTKEGERWWKQSCQFTYNKNATLYVKFFVCLLARFAVSSVFDFSAVTRGVI